MEVELRGKKAKYKTLMSELKEPT